MSRMYDEDELKQILSPKFTIPSGKKSFGGPRKK